MAKKRIKDLNNEATASTLLDNQYAVVDGSTGTFKTKLSALATWIHNKWAAFVNALTAKTSFENGDKIPVVNGSTATAIDATKLLELTAQNALEDVGGAKKEIVGTDIPSTNTGYIKRDGTIANSNDYRYSNHIQVYPGQVITLKAGSPSVNAANMAVYRADGTLTAVYYVSQTTSVETFTHTVVDGEAYIVLSVSNAGFLSLFDCVIGASKLFKDVEDLEQFSEYAENILDDVGVPSFEVTGTDIPSTNAGYIKRDGTIASSSSYRYSNHIQVYPGQVITLKAGSPSVNAANMAVYRADGTLTAVYYVSQTTSVETFTHTVVDGEAYIVLSVSNAGFLSLFDCVIVGTKLFKKVSVLQEDVNTKASNDGLESAKSLSNIFAVKPFYHHFDPEVTAENMGIPSQTLLDVELAKSLGNTLIEFNTHACSDGVLVCKHGNAGKLGLALKTIDGSVLPNDLAAMSFSSVTSTWLREKVVYDGFLSKYCVPIPTLDEVCSKCKELSLMVKIDSVAALAIARKYLPDDMIFTSNITTRGDFKGIMEFVKIAGDNIDTTIAKAKKRGKPCAVCIADGAGMSNISDLLLWNKKIHEAGLLSEIVYNTTNQGLFALSNGVDSICSTNRQINLFEVGNLLNLASLDDSNIVLSNATYNDANDEISIEQGGSIYINFSDTVKAGKVCVSIRYDGTITASCGIIDSRYDLYQYESDGGCWVSYAVAVLPNTTYRSFSRALEVYADEKTVIKGLKVAISSL